MGICCYLGNPNDIIQKGNTYLYIKKNVVIKHHDDKITPRRAEELALFID